MRLFLVQEVGNETLANPRHVIAKVKRLVEHGLGVFSVWLEPRQPIVRFKAGQFLHLALDSFSPESGYWPNQGCSQSHRRLGPDS